MNSDHERAHSSYNEWGKGDCGQLVATNLQSIDLINIVPGPKCLTNKVSEELSRILIPDDLILKTNQTFVAVKTKCDRNCLYNVTSLSIAGTYQHFVKQCQ